VVNATDAADNARTYLTKMLVRVGDKDHAAFQLYRLNVAKLFGIMLRICGYQGSRRGRPLRGISHRLALRGRMEAAKIESDHVVCTIARNRAIDWRRAKGTPRRRAQFR